jgi:7-carboxy-7-deazaguanine synthase
MPGGRPVLTDAVLAANEVKLPVGKMDDVERLDALLNGFDETPIWLQPLSTSPKATALCVQVATERGWRVSLQAHKYAGLR